MVGKVSGGRSRGWPVRAVVLVLAGGMIAAWGSVRAAPPTLGCEEPPDHAPVASFPVDEARQQLSTLAREVLARSAEVQGAQHAGRAARFDLAQTAAAGQPAIGLNAGLGLAQAEQDGDTRREARTGSLGLNVSAPLYDGGRLSELVRYRQRMAEVGELGVGSVQERVVRDAVLTALERRRHTVQLAVHDRYVGKMACLVRQMEQVVELDRGRSSELLQARKGLRQAQLAREDTLAAQRQSAQRLQLLLGGTAILPWHLVGLPLQEVPPLAQVIDDITASPEVQQMRLQAEAMDAYARASRADLAPQVRWQVGTSQSRQSHLDVRQWNAGLTLSLVLADGGAAAAAGNAAAERALAARRQQDALVDDRARSAAALHDTVLSARQRAAQIVDVLRESEQVRAATYEQWARLGRRSLFDLMAAESDHVQLRLAEVNAQHDAWAAVAQLRSVGAGLLPWLVPELAPVAGMR